MTLLNRQEAVILFWVKSIFQREYRNKRYSTHNPVWEVGESSFIIFKDLFVCLHCRVDEGLPTVIQDGNYCFFFFRRLHFFFFSIGSALAGITDGSAWP